jgi:hypothetical protein
LPWAINIRPLGALWISHLPSPICPPGPLARSRPRARGVWVSAPAGGRHRRAAKESSRRGETLIESGQCNETPIRRNATVKATEGCLKRQGPSLRAVRLMTLLFSLRLEKPRFSPRCGASPQGTGSQGNPAPSAPRSHGCFIRVHSRFKNLFLTLLPFSCLSPVQNPLSPTPSRRTSRPSLTLLKAAVTSLSFCSNFCLCLRGQPSSDPSSNPSRAPILFIGVHPIHLRLIGCSGTRRQMDE